MDLSSKSWKAPFFTGRPATHISAPGSLWIVGWYNGPYEHNWALQAEYHIQTYASHRENLLVRVDDPVGDYENPQVMLVQGWR